MALTLLNIYNKVAGQAWSMFDGDVEDEGEFESSLLSSIQKALSDLWCKYPYPFRYKDYNFTTESGVKSYELPNGNIVEKTIEGETKYCVTCNGKYLSYIDDYSSLAEATGTPTSFYLKNDKIFLYPTADVEYSINIEYLTLEVGVNAENTAIFTVSKDTDVIVVPAKYEVLFENALITLSMHYAIASTSNQNYSSYQAQAETAYQMLVK